MKIFIYLPLEAALSALSDKGTFCLKSIFFYKELESKDGTADSQEGMYHRGNKHRFSIRAALLSCWSLPETEEKATPDWSIFNGRPVALQSSVEKVEEYLKANLSDLLSGWELKHRPVSYDALADCPDIDSAEIDTIIFSKRRDYSPQREYRFAWTNNCDQNHLESLIFRNCQKGGWPEYIQKVYFNPEFDNCSGEIKRRQKMMEPWCKLEQRFENWEHWIKAE